MADETVTQIPFTLSLLSAIKFLPIIDGNILVIARFFAKVLIDKGSGCWLWQGAKNKDGYGWISRQYGPADLLGKGTMAHRVIHEWTKGPIPASWEIDHLCRNESCVNPDHLEAVTRGENQRRAKPYRTKVYRARRASAKKPCKLTCKEGHAYTPENTLQYPGYRRCRICEQKRWKANRIKKRQKRDLLKQNAPTSPSCGL